MTVITISRESGSYGDLLAERVARTLGYHLVDKAFISAVLAQYGLTEFEEEYERKPGFWGSFDLEKTDRRDLMLRVLNLLVRTVARHGDAVIRGRSSYAILAGLADVLHVRLQAPLDDRIEAVRAEQNISLEEATALVKDRDAIRTSFVESFYHAKWDDTHAFDLVINTAVVPIGVATDWVIQAAKLRGGKTGDKPTTQLIEIDPVMMQTVTERLGCTADHTQPAA